MSYRVKLTRFATRDLQGIYEYLLIHGGEERADKWMDHLQESVASLAAMPERGSIPAEIQKTGLRQYRQVYCGHYRIIYRSLHDSVFVVMVIDGRRDVRSALLKRQLI